MTYLYYLPEYGETIDDARPVNLGHSSQDWKFLAEEAAYVDHSYHDGWDHEWPAVFAIVVNGEERRFTVGR